MEAFLETAALAVLQGLTEFLPVSSSAHLALGEILLGWRDRGTGFDVALHLGTLLAVLWHFRAELIGLARGAGRLARGEPSPEGRLALALVVASLPLPVGGWILLEMEWRDLFHAVAPIAWINLGFALLLYLADRCGGSARAPHQFALRHALLVGLAQVCALLPGASRAGVVITMGRALGLSRADAARFSMLLAIPAILLSAAALLLENPAAEDPLPVLLTAAAVAFFTARLVIALFLRMMARLSLLVFVLYRVALSAALLGGLYFFA